MSRGVGGNGSTLAIREERPTDRARIHEIESAAFPTALQADLVDVLRRSADPHLSLVALDGDERVGHVFFSPVEIRSAPSVVACQLSPVAVIPDRQRQGIGGRLIRAGLERCPSLGWSAVFLVGSPLYYRRFGFEMAGPRGLSCGGPHDPFLQVLELAPKVLDGVTGHVAFHPAFDEAGSG